MDNKKTETNQPEMNDQDLDTPDNTLVTQFCDSINWGSGIFSIIFMYFSCILVFFNWSMIIQIVSFFEISNLITFSSSVVKDVEITALIAISIAILTGLFVYFRFFSNINHNDFSDDMSDYLRFYETLYSAVFDLTILAILFLYLIFVKQSVWEFFIAFLIIIGLSISIKKITLPHSKMIRDYSAIEHMNAILNNVPKKSAKELFLGKDLMSEFIFFVFMRRKSVLITASFLLTIIVALLGIAGTYNILTIVILELMIIRYTLFQSLVGSVPPIPVTLYIENNEILNRVFIIKESRDILLVLSPSDAFVLIMKSHLKKVEPIIELENPQ